MISSILNKIRDGKLWKFHGGIHPSIKKTATAIETLEQAELPNELVIPVLQHIGQQSELLVRQGDMVKKGQALSNSNDPMAPPIHAPTSGTISMIEKRPAMHPAVIDELSIIIKPDGLDTPVVEAPESRLAELDNNSIRQKIHQAGIAGMGGAGFPSAVKANSKHIDFLIINGAECEPFIQADDALMQVKAKEIIQGINVLGKLLQAKLIIIAIEDDKPFAIAKIKKAISSHAEQSILLRVIPTLYPSGGERQLIKLLTGMEVPSGGLPAHIGVIVHNVGTCYAIKRAVINNEALTERVLTLAGEGFNESRNLMVKLGTPVHSLLKAYAKGISASHSKLLVGGPMMGFTLPHAQIPVTKTCNAILLDSNEHFSHVEDHDACIRCGQCADACPSHLLPQSLYWHSKAGELDKSQALNILDCIECGACDYVCPSKIPLVLQFRQTKSQIKQQQQEAQAASVAKSRFEFREMRLEREKQERAAKHKAAAAKRLAIMEAQKQAAEQQESSEQDSQNAANNTQSDTIAAAIARAKAKKANVETPASKPITKEPILTKEEAQLRLEQRQQRKEQARLYKEQKQAAEHTAQTKEIDSQITHSSSTNESAKTDSGKKLNPAVAAAIARAKAKKAKQNEVSSEAASEKTQERKATTEQNLPSSNHHKPSSSNANPAVAAAIARAKAKKAQQQKLNQQDGSSDSQTQAISQPEPQEQGKQNAPKNINPAVAAAIAKAKAKKQIEQKEASLKATEQGLKQSSELKSTDNENKAAKNPAVAAAIARAKAKKAAQEKANN